MPPILSNFDLEREIAEKDRIEKDLSYKEKRLKGIEETVDGFAVYYRFQSLLAECEKERERVIKIRCEEAGQEFEQVKDIYLFRIEFLIPSFSEVNTIRCHEQAKEIQEIIRKYNKPEFELEDSQLLSFAVLRNNFEDFSKKEKQTIRDLEILCREKQNTIIQILQTQLKGENIVKVLEDEATKKKKKELDEFTAKPENKDRIQNLTGDQIKYLEKLDNEKEWKEYIGKCEARLRNIFSMATPFHWIGWPIFLAAVSFGIRWARKKKKEERKIDNYLDDIKDKFAKWQLNIYLSCAFYVVLFFVAKQFIDYFVEPLVGGWLADKKRFTIASMSFILGVMTIIDNIITSTLKTPLQRLGVKIENSPIPEKEKSKLLSKTQEVNESFKETFKRFGFLAIPSILVSLVGKEEWEKELASNLCYLVPVLWSTIIITRTNRIVRRIERGKRKKVV